MDKTQLTYIVFAAVVFLALLFDLGLLSKKNKEITLEKALLQTAFWVLLSFAFCGFVWYENIGGNGQEDAIQYISAYLLEWSLSIDNIFVFVIIFTYFKVKSENYSRILLLGILMAIVFRIAFIALGSELVARFGWIMFVFGVFLVFTGVKMFGQADEEEFNPSENWAYRFIKRFLRTSDEEPNGRLTITRAGKTYFTSLFIV